MKESDLDYESSVSNLKNRVSIKKLAKDNPKRAGYYFDDLPKELRKYAFYVSGVEKLRTVESIRLSLERAIENGSSFQQWKNSLDTEALKSMTKARQELVFRTNLANAYNQGSRLEAFENKEFAPYRIYQSILDERTRPSHEALDGTIRAVDDSFWDTFTPPIGYNCRCVAISLTKEDASEFRGNEGKSGFITSKQEVEAKARRATGDKKITYNNLKRKLPDSGFDVDQKLGSFTKGAKRTAELALEKLPNSNPYKKKFKEQIESIDRKVAIWFDSVKNKLKP